MVIASIAEVATSEESSGTSTVDDGFGGEAEEAVVLDPSAPQLQRQSTKSALAIQDGCVLGFKGGAVNARARLTTRRRRNDVRCIRA